MKTHAIAHHYCFQLKKCGKEDCKFNCTPLRCPPEVAETLSYVPDPQLDSCRSKFKAFDDVYGELTSEKDRPSMGTEADQHDQEYKALLVSNKARMTVTCCQCEKPRVVYSQFRLQPGVDKYLLELAEFLMYTCGSPLFFELPESWPDEVKENAPVVRENKTCSSPVEFAYYSCQKFPDVCAHCADRDCSIVAELKHSFRTVLPTCTDCITAGKEPVTRGKYKRPSQSVSQDSSKKTKTDYFLIVESKLF